MNTLKRTIPANSFERINAPCLFVYAEVAPVKFRIETENGHNANLEQGDVAVFPQTDALNIVNDTGSPITVELLVGIEGGFKKAPPSSLTVSSSTTINSVADYTTTASAVEVLASNGDRSEVLIKNIGVNACRVGDSLITASRGMKLAPGDSIVLTVTAAIFAVWESGATDISILEVAE